MALGKKGVPNYKQLAKLYQQTLLKDVIPFWCKHSVDRDNGGYFTCLSRDGTVFDTDKFIWLQCRQVWTFSMLYNQYKDDNWLSIAEHGIKFLNQFGTDGNGNWYFALDRSGRPLIQPYNIFSDCFAAMAYSQYYQATGNKKAKETAITTYRNIIKRKRNPKGRYNKIVPETRPMISLALPMIIANLSAEMEVILECNEAEKNIMKALDEINNLFFNGQHCLIHENVSPNGGKLDCFDGRLINPGHSLEAMWFIMDIARRKNNDKLISWAVDVILSTLDFSWDREYGGIFYFLDINDKPPQQLEWNQKLWWVHLETLISLIMAYTLTGNRECWEWYEKVHTYTWEKFPDPEYGEWFGYLNRQGQRLYDLKGGKWKGCFHLPRAFYILFRQFENLSKTHNTKRGELGENQILYS